MLDRTEPKHTLTRRQLVGLLLAPAVGTTATLLTPFNARAKTLSLDPRIDSSAPQEAPALIKPFTKMPSPMQADLYPQVTTERSLDVPFYRQPTSGTCARGAVLSVVNYYREYRSLDDPEVKNALPEYAFLVNHVMPSIKKLTSGRRVGEHNVLTPDAWLGFVRTEIRASRPVLALIPNGRNLDWDWERAHYIVIRGFNNAAEKISFVDPWKDTVNNPYGYWEAGFDYIARAWGAPTNSFGDAFGWQAVRTPRLITS